MIQIAGQTLDNQELLVLSIEHIGYKPANLGNAKNADGIDIIESGVSTNKTGKYMDESIEVKDKVEIFDIITTKSLDISVGVSESTFKIRKINIITVKNLDVLVGDQRSTSKIAEINIIVAKNSDISVKSLGDIGSLENATKSMTIITERQKTLIISGIRVLMITNLNNLALAPTLFIFSGLGIDIGMPTSVFFVAFHYELSSLSSLYHTFRTTSTP